LETKAFDWVWTASRWPLPILAQVNWLLDSFSLIFGKAYLGTETIWVFGKLDELI
jgi:hypothetical protein